MVYNYQMKYFSYFLLLIIFRLSWYLMYDKNQSKNFEKPGMVYNMHYGTFWTTLLMLKLFVYLSVYLYSYWTLRKRRESLFLTKGNFMGDIPHKSLRRSLLLWKFSGVHAYIRFAWKYITILLATFYGKIYFYW